MRPAVAMPRGRPSTVPPLSSWRLAIGNCTQDDPKRDDGAVTVRLRADVLRAEVSSRGLTIERFATLSGVSAGTLSRALNGKPVTARTRAALAGTLCRVPPIEGARELVDDGSPLRSN